MLTSRLKETAFYFALYALIRSFSFYFRPEQSLANTLVSAAILAASLYCIYRRDDRGWLIVAGEFILGGAGNFLALGPLALRTCLVATTVPLYIARNFPVIKRIWQEQRFFILLAGMLALCAAIAGVRGWYLGNSLPLIIADCIPYLSLLYAIPLFSLAEEKKFVAACLTMLGVAIIGNAIFTLGTFIAFSTHLTHIHESYYKWFRDVAGGKITDLHNHFFRIVLNEHLALVPLLGFFTYRLVNFKKATATETNKSLSSPTITLHSTHEVPHSTYAIIFSLLLILSLNLTRIYLLAFIVILFLLFSKKHFRRWILISLCSIATLITLFSVIHLSASRGESVGWELFGVRLGSIAAPSIEESSLSRLLLLPKITEKIKNRPLLGEGLGDELTVYSPVVKTTVTTSHFDWGYLEILAEFGFFGSVGWVALLVFAVITTARRLASETASHLFAMLGALGVENLTSPIFFHGIGLALVMLILVLALRKKSQTEPLLGT